MSDTVNEICSDNRFDVIENVKNLLIEKTNIESSDKEMAVIDNFLFRMWQIGLLPEQYLEDRWK